MLSRLFKKSIRLEHPDREKRLQAVQALTVEQAADAQETLERLAVEEADVTIRHAVLHWIKNTDVLAVLLDAPEHAEVAAKIIVQRIKAGETPSCQDHALILQTRISQADDDDLVSLLPLITDASQAAELALQCRDTAREQVLALPVLCSEAGLAGLQKISKGRNKSCHRYARERLDSIKTARTACQAARVRVSELDASISKALITEPTDNPSLIAQRHLLIKLNDMRMAAASQFNTVHNTLINAGGDNDQQPLSANPLAEYDLSIPDPADNPFIALTEQFLALSQAMFNCDDLATVREQRDTLTTDWVRHADKFPPTLEQHNVFERVANQFRHYASSWERLTAVTDSIKHVPAALSGSVSDSHTLPALSQGRRKWLKRWQKPLQSINWPPDHTEPEILTLAQSHLERVQTELEQLHKQELAAQASMAEVIAQANTALEDGKIEVAKGHLRAARNWQKQGISEFDQDLSVLSAQVAEFTDWQKFATDPKRQELLTNLNKIAEEPLEPSAQAAHLKELREQWRALGKPTNRQDIEQQKQFDDLADKAFAPCRAYFAELADERASNLAQREALCEQLEEYLTTTDWSTADMQAAETIMRTAREAWHTYHPCERRALKPVQKRFDDLQDALHGKVKAAWAANVEAKQAIVDRARALLTDEDSNAVDGAKTLQQEWQNIGRTPRGADQRLWREFRKLCDDIFAQRDVARNVERAELNSRYTAYEERVVALETAASEDNPSRKQLTELLTAITDAGDGLSLRPNMQKRVESAQATYRAALAGEDRKLAETDLDQWQNWDEMVSSAEQAGDAIDAPHAVFAERIAGKPAQTDLLELTIEAEIAADLASPPADQATRMALQIAFMNAGKRNLAAEDYRQLRRRWCEAGPKDATANPLRERFFIALKARI